MKKVGRVGGGPAFINDTGGTMVLIRGEDPLVESGSVHIENAIGRRSQASFNLQTDTSKHYEQYEQVYIYDENTVGIFTGYIYDPREQVSGSLAVLNHSISAIDQHFCADKRRVAVTFTNKSIGYMVKWVVDNVLAEEGVTIGEIYDGLLPSKTLYPSATLYPRGGIGLVPEAVFVYCKVSEALDALATAASASGVPYYWQIDKHKQLWFLPYTSVVNSNVVDGTLVEEKMNPPSIRRVNPKYRNYQYATGGVTQTSTQVETRKGDSNITSWPMNFKLAKQPIVKVNTVAKTVGIRGVETGKDFYWNKGEYEITQDSGGTKLTSSDTLEVTYIGEYATVFVAQDAGQVEAQRQVDGTSGIVEDVENDPTITSADAGFNLVSALLTHNARKAKILEFTTRQKDFEQGQLATVDMPWFDLSNAQMLIESVSASDSDGLHMFYSITAIEGPADQSWVSFFSKLLKTQQPASNINVGSSQTLTTLQQFRMTITPVASLNINVYACPVPGPSTTLPFTPC